MYAETTCSCLYDNQAHPERAFIIKKGVSQCQNLVRAKLVGEKQIPKREPIKDPFSRNDNLHRRIHLRGLGSLSESQPAGGPWSEENKTSPSMVKKCW